ncbi:MAG TPA: hypothetical protein VMF32_12995, partial [Xanthobacteraceae bacterium]|nr:hypothetical protein [Xanthobacteraceae bacterium]
WAVSFSSRLGSADLLSIETDAADICERTINQAAADNIPEARRIALTVKCVDVLSEDLDGLSRDARVPFTFISSYEANVAILRRFQDAGKLSPQQSEVLNRAETLVRELRQR